MRGDNAEEGAVFSYVSAEERVPRDHPLRVIRRMVDAAFKQMSPEFDRMYSRLGRPSIPPEKLLRALLLQVLYSVRSERQLMEQMDYNLLFRWFVGLSMDEPVWDASSFSKNRERLLEAEIAKGFFREIRDQAQQRGWLSDEHFTVDGTLIEAWASQKSFRPKGESGGAGGTGEREAEGGFRGQKRSNETHASTTDPDARLAKKGGGEARLSYMGHVLMENRNGLVVDELLSLCSGRAEQEAAVKLLARRGHRRRVTVGLDKAYDVRSCIQGLRECNATPHVAQKKTHSSVDGRTVNHPGYGISQRLRKRIEEIFGWAKTVGQYRKTKFRGRPRVGWAFTFVLTAYNILRMSNLTLQEAME
jgi:transposase